jgi:hypothetical protein
MQNNGKSQNLPEMQIIEHQDKMAVFLVCGISRNIQMHELRLHKLSFSENRGVKEKH